MKEQIISIAPDGTIYGLDFKSKGVSLRDFGKAQIERITSIEWSDERQAWFVAWVHDRHEIDNKAVWRFDLFQIAEVDATSFGGFWHSEANDEDVFASDLDPVTYFDSYESANAAEVAVIQSLRLRGKLAA